MNYCSDLRIVEVLPSRPIEDVKALSKFLLGSVEQAARVADVVTVPREVVDWKRIELKTILGSPAPNDIGAAQSHFHYNDVTICSPGGRSGQTVVESVKEYFDAVEMCMRNDKAWQTFFSQGHYRKVFMEECLTRTGLFAPNVSDDAGQFTKVKSAFIQFFGDDPKHEYKMHTDLQHATSGHFMNWAKKGIVHINKEVLHGRGLLRGKKRSPGKEVYGLHPSLQESD
ncbi:MAG: hypothetical protein HOO67_05710 [Candidatus Peribacteraceae bacterium]|nr:hypothetical protein [Candidatus Peribacteraceae bacterium]